MPGERLEHELVGELGVEALRRTRLGDVLHDHGEVRRRAGHDRRRRVHQLVRDLDQVAELAEQVEQPRARLAVGRLERRVADHAALDLGR